MAAEHKRDKPAENTFGGAIARWLTSTFTYLTHKCRYSFKVRGIGSLLVGQLPALVRLPKYVDPELG